MKNKKILFIAPNFFGYELAIKKELEKLGAAVDFYDDRPSNSFFYKALIRKNPKVIAKLTHKYFQKITKENKHKNYDYVFFIKCEAALEKDLKLLRNTFGTAQFILYLYDSVSNIKFYNMKKKYFDAIFSFDFKDANENSEMHFRPLFYLDEYKKKHITCTYKYDLSFIGTAHSDRPQIINQLRQQLDSLEKNYYFRLYVPSKVIFYFKLIFDKDFRALNKTKCIVLEKVDVIKISQILDESNLILDIHHPKQNGLTMRTIELIGMNKKIITTNKSIKDYEFYNQNNIEIIDRKKPILDTSFFNLGYETLNNEVYKKYSIHSWIEEIFKI